MQSWLRLRFYSIFNKSIANVICWQFTSCGWLTGPILYTIPRSWKPFYWHHNSVKQNELQFISCIEYLWFVTATSRINDKDASTVYLYRCHNPTTLQKNLHLDQKGVMNEVLASIWLMNDLRLIWIQSVSMCSQFCRSQSNAIYTAYGVKL